WATAYVTASTRDWRGACESATRSAGSPNPFLHKGWRGARGRWGVIRADPWRDAWHSRRVWVRQVGDSFVDPAAHCAGDRAYRRRIDSLRWARAHHALERGNA